MVIKVEKLIAADPERLAEVLLSLYKRHKSLKKELDIAFAALNDNPKKILQIIDKEIQKIQKSHSQVRFRDTQKFIQHFLFLHDSLCDHTLKAAPQETAVLLTRWMDLHDHVTNRLIYDHTQIFDMCHQACITLGEVYSNLACPPQQTVDLIMDKWGQDTCGIYRDLIYHMKGALGPSGLELLTQRLDRDPPTLDPIKIKTGLQAVADASKDVDRYIQACQRAPHAMGPQDRLEIARRLNNHWRSEEALNYLDGGHTMPTELQKQYCMLKAESLELCGHYDQAQKERLHYFQKSLCFDTYQHLLKNCDMDTKMQIKDQCLQAALEFHDPRLALTFLMHTHEYPQMAEFILAKIDYFDGQEYPILRPAAMILESVAPRAASLIYRKLIDYIMTHHKSQNYTYAAKDLLICDNLNLKITDWQPFASHGDYFKKLKAKHHFKSDFWEMVRVLRVKAEMQKEAY